MNNGTINIVALGFIIGLLIAQNLTFKPLLDAIHTALTAECDGEEGE
jgi:hypothetical protein